MIVGPTASGKTALAEIVARRLSIEVISADSMQVYRGMRILTQASSPRRGPVSAWLTSAMRGVPRQGRRGLASAWLTSAMRGVPRQGRRGLRVYLSQTLDPKSEYNAALFLRRARRLIGAIRGRKKIPVVVGGTGLYVSALLEGLFRGPGEDPTVRRRLAEEARRDGVSALHARLSSLDPAAAARIHPNDLRRIIRALEVIELMSRPFSEVRKTRSGLWESGAVLIYGLSWDRAALYRRIEERVDRMFEEGAVEEVRRISKHALSKTAAACLGVKEIRAVLEGRSDAGEARAALKRNTRRFAKRQIAWFKRDKRIRWIPMENEASFRKAAGIILEDVKRFGPPAPVWKKRSS